MEADAGGAVKTAVNLSDVDEEGVYVVVSVSGTEAQLRRLNDIGFVPGMRFMVVSCPNDGMMVVRIGPGRIALARGTSNNVWVRRRS